MCWGIFELCHFDTILFFRWFCWVILSGNLSIAKLRASGHNCLAMNVNQEEAFFDFLDNVSDTFELDDIVAYIKRIEPNWMNRLSPRWMHRLIMDVEAFINLRGLAFPAGSGRWVSRRGFFEPISFVISPTRLELVNGIFIPGHRCVPFGNSNLLPHEYTFFWQGSRIPVTSTEGSPQEFYPYYAIYGEEFAPQYVARDNSENEEAFNKDPYDDPPEVSVKTLDMRNIYRETAFVPGDRFLVQTTDWMAGNFKLEKVGKDEWSVDELKAWFDAAEGGFERSFKELGPASCTEEQIAFAYWYGAARMREVPAYALEEYLYEKTGMIQTAAYGIETRFWYAGREIPDRNDLDVGNIRPDKTPVEEILAELKIPVSEYVVHSYIRDSLYRREEDGDKIIERLVPAGVEFESQGRSFLGKYIKSVQDEIRKFYSPFADKLMGPIRSRAGELHTAIIDLVASLNKGDIDHSWLPRHTFIILSQIQNHAAQMMEDLDSDTPPHDAELEAMDNSLDSMVETYEDIKEQIDEALDSLRRNKFGLVRAKTNLNETKGRLLQFSISGIDVWRRLIVPENCTLEELDKIIQAAFGWCNSKDFKISAEKTLELDTTLKSCELDGIMELHYEYGTKWTVKVIILSRCETPDSRPVRCLTGAGAAPPDFIGGPIKFKKMLSALESKSDLERIRAKQQLGAEFMYGEFDLEICNQKLNSLASEKKSKEIK